MQDAAADKDEYADIFLSSRMNIWIGCSELEGRYDARPGCSGQNTRKSWKQQCQLPGALQSLSLSAVQESNFQLRSLSPALTFSFD